MKADKHQAQRVIREGLGVLLARAGRGNPPRVLQGDAVLLFVPALFPAQVVQREVAGGLTEPRRGFVGHAAIRPGLQGAHERLLHRIFSELQVVRSELANQHRHQPRAFPAKQITSDFARASRGLRRAVSHGGQLSARVERGP
jgi:hypothetical protein